MVTLDRRSRFPGVDWTKVLSSLESLRDCAMCPRECHADRSHGDLGYCCVGDEFSIASVCTHRGEEPPISGKHGICNIFFARCNLQCSYCQNHDISRNDQAVASREMDIGELLGKIVDELDSGARGVGFVSPSHCLPQMQSIMAGLSAAGVHPTYIYNTNSYDRVESLRSLEGQINVYLPDLKYLDPRLAADYSDCPDYPEVACEALKEMFRQSGAEIALDDDGYITHGMIIRHLVIPGQVENSKAVLRFIAEELSTDVHISLMSQYYPTPAVRDHPELGRFLRPEEYTAVTDEFERLGFWRGFVQELESSRTYRPDFFKLNPFGEDLV